MEIVTVVYPAVSPEDRTGGQEDKRESVELFTAEEGLVPHRLQQQRIAGLLPQTLAGPAHREKKMWL